ncbi:adenylyltransferase/cytidyltransferase family protein [Nocardia elegans]|uniref:Adenylyltransferase/cytidyltransferase family protein n=1 Tax=Nocardia elegans TaxID=300029 RepID=A0ABW6TJI5_9NOCA
MTPYGIVLGRFQPLHHGHVEYLDAAKERCERLFIGITNPDTSQATIDEADVKRSRSENNPFSYIDRHLMIERALLELDWPSESFCLIAAPITNPVRLAAYLPSPDKSEFFVTIYDEWGEQKAREISALGYVTTTLWRRTYEERFTSGTFVREAIRSGKRWEHLVPPGVSNYIVENKLTGIV